MLHQIQYNDCRSSYLPVILRLKFLVGLLRVREPMVHHGTSTAAPVLGCSPQPHCLAAAFCFLLLPPSPLFIAYTITVITLLYFDFYLLFSFHIFDKLWLQVPSLFLPADACFHFHRAWDSAFPQVVPCSSYLAVTAII